MITLEKVIRQRDMFRAKAELMRMLTELSDDALRLVWRPIVYAYYFTDDHNAMALTGDDVDRLGLISSAAIDPSDVTHEVSLYCSDVRRSAWERRARK